MKISAVILTKNEEESITRAIDSVGFCDEIIIVDDNSTDNTLETIQKIKSKNLNGNLEIRVLQRRLDGDFAKQRNYGLEKARGEWVLFIDADEIVPPKLQEEIKREVNKFSKIKGFKIKRRDFIFGKELKFTEAGKRSLLRLGRKGYGKWQRRVHEFWDIDGTAKALKTPLIHFPHQTITSFVEEINFYSTLHSEANSSEGKRSTLGKIIFWPIFKLVDNLILKLGILGGSRGFIVAMIMSFHSYLAWSKQWISQNRK